MITIVLEGKEYLLDIEQAKQLGLLKEKGSIVKSWDEFKDKYRYKTAYYVGPDNVVNTTCDPGIIQGTRQLTPHESKALSAFSKLLKLRRDWIGEWEPDWESFKTKCYTIECVGNVIRIDLHQIYSRTFSFPTEKMAKEFLDTFSGLIEEAKILI